MSAQVKFTLFVSIKKKLVESYHVQILLTNNNERKKQHLGHFKFVAYYLYFF